MNSLEQNGETIGVRRWGKPIPPTVSDTTDRVREHYDQFSFLYLRFWGEYFHHGYWERENESMVEAQVHLLEHLAMYSGLSDAAQVLQVGSGIGGTASWLARCRHCRVMGLTLSPVQRWIADQRHQSLRLQGKVKFGVFAQHSLLEEPQLFDAIWIIESSEHMADKAGFIRNCVGCLKPGGKLAVCALLKNDSAMATREKALLDQICQGMLCPSLGTAQDYIDWLEQSGCHSIQWSDITDHVRPTWKVCGTVLRRPEIQAMLQLSGSRIRLFADAFFAIDEAYARGAMNYGMLTARVP